ncbi:hypothetical protein BHE74_00045059, partial [Ensete ventricosum]
GDWEKRSAIQEIEEDGSHGEKSRPEDRRTYQRDAAGGEDPISTTATDIAWEYKRLDVAGDDRLEEYRQRQRG